MNSLSTSQRWLLLSIMVIAVGIGFLLNEARQDKILDLKEKTKELSTYPPKIKPAVWHYIVIHHSATKGGTSKGMDTYHRKKRRMINGLAYHFVIGNGIGTEDGLIEVGSRWEKQILGGHVKDDQINKIAIGICLIGDFTHKPPTEKQMHSLLDLVSGLMSDYNIPQAKVMMHKEMGQSECPGKSFPWEEFQKKLDDKIATQSNPV